MILWAITRPAPGSDPNSFLTRRIDADQPIRVFGTSAKPALQLGDSFVQVWLPSYKCLAADHIPCLAVTDDRDRAVPIGSE
jgi:hypothetical protein